MDTLIQKLNELIFDENRIVSYKTLSKACCVHVNTAKEALNNYLETRKYLNASYLLAGFIVDGESRKYHVAVAPASKLEEMRSKFSQLDSCHVYSLHKTIIKDSGMLYSESKYQGETSPRAVIQNSSLKQKIRRCSPVVAPQSLPQKKDEKKIIGVSAMNGSQEDEVEKPKDKSTEPRSKSQTGGKKKQANGKAGKGIMAAFAKGTSTVKKPSPATAKKESPEPPSKDETKSKNLQNGSKSPEEKTKSLKKAEKQMWSDSESSDEEPIPAKKSRAMSRIKQLPESDSEDEPQKKEETESVLSLDLENEEEESPQEQTAMQLVSILNTYQDEDGNLVTRKEHKMEEIKVTDVKPLPPKVASRPANNNPTKKRQKKSPPEDSKKQASLMSFFTRK